MKRRIPSKLVSRKETLLSNGNEKAEKVEEKAVESAGASELQEMVGELSDYIETLNVMPTTRAKIRSTLLAGTRETAFRALEKLAAYGDQIEAAQKVSQSVRSTPDGNGGKVALGMRIVPKVLEPLLGDILAQGARPHARCPHCVCPPEGGVILDEDRSKLATEAAAEVLKRFPIETTVLVGKNLSGNPFSAKKSGGGGRGGGAKSELPIVGTRLRGTYKGADYEGVVIENDAGQRRILFQGAEYTSKSQAVQKGLGYQTSGNRFWEEIPPDEPEDAPEDAPEPKKEAVAAGKEK